MILDVPNCVRNSDPRVHSSGPVSEARKSVRSANSVVGFNAVWNSEPLIFATTFYIFLSTGDAELVYFSWYPFSSVVLRFHSVRTNPQTLPHLCAMCPAPIRGGGGVGNGKKFAV